MAFSPRCFIWVCLLFSAALFLPSMAEDPLKPSLNASHNVDSSFQPFDSAPPRSPFSPRPNIAPFRPSIAVIVGVLTTMFSITFLLLLYAKHCKRGGTNGGGSNPNSTFQTNAARRNSGIDRGIIESLPIFRFGSLQGEKDGLECAVCLCRFELSELLRLLPKCRHAFHIECVDTWLDAHSTCPLCRYRVDPEDVLLVAEPPAMDGPTKPEVKTGHEIEADLEVGYHRVSGRHSSAGERSSGFLQLIFNGRRSVDIGRLNKSTGQSEETVSISCFERTHRRDTLLATDRDRFEHRIVISDSAAAIDHHPRWGHFKPSDLLYLPSEKIVSESGRYSLAHRRASCSAAQPSNARDTDSKIIKSRCVSEITGLSRFRRAEEEMTVIRNSKWLGFAATRTEDENDAPET
ncbi:RING-H2 finger protein ATL43-like [Aristolochia californica]|uniref:RING-H2 finger protein ATL43-like n=1 Tax=Aristolochia californica TaxID=171875 RepID=UPI0035DC6AFA